MSEPSHQQRPVLHWVAMLSLVFGVISIGASMSNMILASPTIKSTHYLSSYATFGTALFLLLGAIAAFIPAILGLCLAVGALALATKKPQPSQWPSMAVWVNVTAFIAALIALLMVFHR